MVDSALAVVVLFVATILSVYKPWGRMDAKRLGLFVVVLTVIVLVLIVLRHVNGRWSCDAWPLNVATTLTITSF